MIFERHRKLPYPEMAASGRPLCRSCLTEIPAGSRRSTFCSDACGEDAAIRASAGYAREKVFERDKGVCAECGMDTEYVKSLVLPLVKEAADRHESDPELSRALRYRVWLELEAMGFSARVARGVAGIDRAPWFGALGAHLWEMDHETPVVHGGGSCGLSNLRTLCRRCHHAATAKLAAVRAKDRHVRRKQDRHAERMAMKARGEQLPLSRKWRRR